MAEFDPILVDQVRARIRDVPDFPKPGIIFKDLMPVFGDGPLFRALITAFAQRFAGRVDAVVGIEARGWVLAAPVAAALGKGLVLLRKPGKLPFRTERQTYDLEYGQDALEIHVDALSPGARVVVIDDLLATGGTMRAACELLRGRGAQIVEASFVVELAFLRGRDRLDAIPASAVVAFE